MKPRLTAGTVSVLTCAGLLFAVHAPSAALAAEPGKFEIVPGESIGPVSIGDSRKAVERQLGEPVDHAKDGDLYFSTYRYPKRDRNGNRGGKLTIVFAGLARGARVGYMSTQENSLGTRQGIGVGDTYSELLGTYPGISCYHAEPNGDRDPVIEDNENFECELNRNGGFTYFSFASFDADPSQSIGVVAVSAIPID